MTIYSAGMLMALEDPYQQLIVAEEGTSLIDNQRELEQLTSNQQRTVITKLILQCPVESLHQLPFRTNALHEAPTFRQKLLTALEVRNLMMGIIDGKIAQPHALFVSNMDLLNEFSFLAQTLAKNHINQLATQFILYTPERDRSRLLKDLNTVFCGSGLSALVENGMVLMRLIDIFLGDRPAHMFTQADYDVSLFHQFPDVIQRRLPASDDLTDIVDKLIQPQSTMNSYIAKELGLMAKTVPSSPPHTLQTLLTKFNQQAESRRPHKPIRQLSSIFTSVSGDESVLAPSTSSPASSSMSYLEHFPPPN